MDQDDPEKRIAEPEDQQWDAAAGGPISTTRGELTADDVHNLAFPTPPRGIRGYDEAAVDAFLQRLEQHLRNPQTVWLTAAEVDSVAFSKPPIGQRGYDQHAVDAFLERVVQELKRTIGIVEQQRRAGVADQARFPAAAGDVGGQTGSRPERRRVRIANWLMAIIFVGALLVILGIGVHHVYGYLSGTPTTATIVGCHGGSHSIHKTCKATWDVDGESHTGTIEGNIGGYPPGSSLDVHVRGSGAYTATSGFLYFGVAAGPSIIAVVLLFGLWRLRRPGAAAAPGRHALR